MMATPTLVARQAQPTTTGVAAFLELLSTPFANQQQSQSIYISIGYSFGASAGLCFLFCLLRPRNSAVYAPRAKHADKKHAPPPIGKGFLSWIKPIRDVKEAALVEEIGVDAVIFLRFLKMARHIFLCLTVVGCAMLIPITLIGGSDLYKDWPNVPVLMRITPQYFYGTKFWAYVVYAYAADGIVMFWLYHNYRAVTRLRRAYFESQDYQNSLHSRTLLVRHIPKAARTEDGLKAIVEKVKQTDDVARATIARNTKGLPELIEEHEEAVEDLERCLAKYLANPDKLPTKRPMCKPNKNDQAFKGQHKVDAIDYLAGRVKELETEINEIRETVDKRNPLPYGFASFTHIEDAHAIAWAAKKRGPEGTVIALAPKPNDLIWKNLPLTRNQYRRKSIWINFWITVLTVAYVAPNVLSAIFLTNFAHLGVLWPWFQRNLNAHATVWAAVQGILAPALQQLFYMFLPSIFRRLLVRSGDPSKTQRERHVLNRLYFFFVFNNLIVFSTFASAWNFVAFVVAADKASGDTWSAIVSGHIAQNVTTTLCFTSSYWVTWQMQRNLGAAIDLLQGFTLLGNWFQRRFTNPTPRRMIQLSAPQPFLYADYYNSYLFVITSGFVFGPLQPLILPIVAIYIGLDGWLKKYLLQYIFVTKVESGGAFWRNVFNRLLFATLLSNAVIALVVTARGSWTMLYCMAPLPIILFLFKIYCKRTFDRRFKYYSILSLDQLDSKESAMTSGNAKQEKKMRKTIDRVGVKFGHPALYQPLTRPMVHAKAQHLLKDVLRGQLDTDVQANGLDGSSDMRGRQQYSDIYMSQMSQTQTGKPAPHFAGEPTSNTPAFEIVKEDDLDFENFKRRAEFRHEFGGDGELYGIADDMVSSRPGTPSNASIMTMSTLANGGGEGGRGRRLHSPASTNRDVSSGSRSGSRPAARVAETTYSPGYAGLRGIDESPERAAELRKWESGDITDDRGALLRNAAIMGRRDQIAGGDGENAQGHLLAPRLQGMNSREFFDVGASGYSTAAHTPGEGLTPMLDEEDETSYDYFRRAGGRGRL